MSAHLQNTEDRLIRLREVLRLVPVSRSTWWAGVKSGIYPQSIKLGRKITCWRLSDILGLISRGVGPMVEGEARGSDPFDTYRSL